MNHHRKSITSVADRIWRVLLLLAAVTGLLSPARAMDPEIQEEVDRFLRTPVSELMPGGSENKAWWEMVNKLFPREIQSDPAAIAPGHWFESPPAPGVHPRVLIRPEQVPDLRRHILGTDAGQRLWGQFGKSVDAYETNANYQRLREALLTGARYADLKTTWVEDSNALSAWLMATALRVLVEPDRYQAEIGQLARRYAEVQEEFFLEEILPSPQYHARFGDPLLPEVVQKLGGPKPLAWTNLRKPLNNFRITLIYDLLHNRLNTEEQDTLRRVIARYNQNLWVQAMAIPAGGGNWEVFHTPSLFIPLSIEGEPGFNPQTLENARAIYKAFYSNGYTQLGTLNEASGKGGLVGGMSQLPFGALRGWPEAANPAVGRSYTWTALYFSAPEAPRQILLTGGLGGMRAGFGTSGLHVLRSLYPQDAAIEYAYRVMAGADQKGLVTRIATTDYQGTYDNLFTFLYYRPVDTTVSTEALFAGADLPTTAFDPEWAFLSSRTGWDKDALWLHTFARTVNWGHTAKERGHFTIHADGRPWAIYPFTRSGAMSPFRKSVMTVDHVGTSGENAATIGHGENGWAHFITYDLRYAWDWTTTRVGDDDLPDPVSRADFMPLADPRPADILPAAIAPHHIAAGRPSLIWSRVAHYPVRHAYRSVGLVEGEYPYVLVMDDMRKDDAEHWYQWNMQLPDDVLLEKVEGADVYLKEKNGDRRLLVRVLQTEAGAPADAVPAFEVEQSFIDPGETTQFRIYCNTLQIRHRCVDAAFKVMIYPLGTDRPLPVTRMRGQELDIQIGGQKDRYRFEVDDNGLSRFRLERPGSPPLTPEIRQSVLPIDGPTPAHRAGYRPGQ